MAMMSLLLDTNAYSGFKQGRPEAIEVIRHAPFIGMSSIVLGELRAGFAVGTHEETNLEELSQFLASKRVRLLWVDENTSQYYANVYKMLRSKGRPIPTNDMWIAALALQHNLAVFSYGDRFTFIDGLSIGSRLTDFM